MIIKGKNLSWHQKEIALIQLQTQQVILEQITTETERNMRPESGKKAWRYLENLRLQGKLLRAAMEEIAEKPCDKKRFYSPWIVKVYKWATKDRFKL